MNLVQRLIAAFKSLSNHFSSYDAHLSNIERLLQEHISAIRERNQTEIERERETIPSSGASELKVPRTIKTETVLKHEEQDPWRYIKFSLEIATFFAIMLYAEFTGFQVYEMRSGTFTAKKSADEALKQSERLFIADQRPWIGMTISQPKDVDADTSEVEVFYINSGRTPAKVMKVGFTHHTFVRFPADPPYERHPTDIPGVSIAVPNSNLSNTDRFPKLTPERIAEMTAKHEHFFLYAEIEYEDPRSHTTHWTHACWEFLPNFHNMGLGFVNCSTYNEIDSAE